MTVLKQHASSRPRSKCKMARVYTYLPTLCHPRHSGYSACHYSRSQASLRVIAPPTEPLARPISLQSVQRVECVWARSTNYQAQATNSVAVEPIDIYSSCSTHLTTDNCKTQEQVKGHTGFAAVLCRKGQSAPITQIGCREQCAVPLPPPRGRANRFINIYVARKCLVYSSPQPARSSPLCPAERLPI